MRCGEKSKAEKLFYNFFKLLKFNQKFESYRNIFEILTLIKPTMYIIYRKTAKKKIKKKKKKILSRVELIQQQGIPYGHTIIKQYKLAIK
jgi:hypothetical protein